MQFNDYFTHYQLAKSAARGDRTLQKMDARQFFYGYVHQLDIISRTRHGKPLEEVDPLTPNLIQMETCWHESQRPYYNLWPSIIPALTKLRMDADCQFFELPLEQLLLRFPITNNPLTWTDAGKEWSVRAVLCGNVDLVADSIKTRGVLARTPEERPTNVSRGLAMWLDIHEPLEEGEGDGYGGPQGLRLHRVLYKHLVCEPGKSIEWSFDNLPDHDSASVGVAYPGWILRDVARIVCTLCLMAEDKELVEPIVLKADEEKFARTGDLSLVTKAVRRGNYGFNVGRNIEVSPHVRSASPAALYWTGEGRKIPRIRFRRGTVVHRKRLASVPTGFLDKENAE